MLWFAPDMRSSSYLLLHAWQFSLDLALRSFSIGVIFINGVLASTGVQKFCTSFFSTYKVRQLLAIAEETFIGFHSWA